MLHTVCLPGTCTCCAQECHRAATSQALHHSLTHTPDLWHTQEECEKLHNEVRDLKERNNHVEVELLKAEKLKGAVEKASKDIKALVDM